MPEKPELSDKEIANTLWIEYGLNVEEISFKLLGADRNTAVYRVVTKDHAVYFVKLRKTDFNSASVEVPCYLSTRGVKQIIPPIRTITGKLWAKLDTFRIILYLYVEGRNGFERCVLVQIRSENDSEFLAKKVRKVLSRLTVKPLFFEPGSLWWNGYIESFNGKMLDELLSREIFYSL